MTEPITRRHFAGQLGLVGWVGLAAPATAGLGRFVTGPARSDGLLYNRAAGQPRTLDVS